jgi:outer membrane receptor protein involved in Fe transport
MFTKGHQTFSPFVCLYFFIMKASKKLYLMRIFLPIFLFVLLTGLHVKAQQPAGGYGAKQGRQNMNVGHIYGKVVDSKTNKGIDAATVQLVGKKFDTVAKKLNDVVLATLFTEKNGDFSIENLPVFGKMTLHITMVGYKDVTQPVSFDIKMNQGANSNATSTDASGDNSAQQNRMQQMIGMIDKDLGNIKIEQSDATLGNVTVTATKPFFEMGVDRKIFNVDKNIVSTGQTATEVMKQIPSLNVDIDGNVTMRNATPQLFVDGRPTTLTLDQIPADLIDKVELITNPSAKYDASGGGGGILNIILKKNIRKGYNGGIRAGVDSRGKINTGLDLSYRHGKFNFFVNGNYNQRLTKYTQTTDRNNYGDTSSYIHMNDKGQNDGSFRFIRGGLDYFIDNRNTITGSMQYFHGNFVGTDDQLIDSTINGVFSSTSNRYTNAVSNFQNINPTLSFKHNFAKNGHDITADVRYNSSTNDNNSLYPWYNSVYEPLYQSSTGSGYTHYWIVQSDYENPLTDNSKLEAGVRAAIRDNQNSNFQYFSPDSGKTYEMDTSISSSYKYNDQVYAAYLNYSLKTKKWNYQLGLRVESSDYTGTQHNLQTGVDSTFKVKYPVSLFPSAFVTYKIADRSDLQLNYSRRINRPNFFQLIPFVNYNDPQNLSVGNPDLKPEFTNAFEVSYDKTYNHGGNFLATAYLKYTTDLITNYQYLAPNPNPVKNDSVIFNTYENANSSISYGLELTDKNTFFKIWDMTLNVNLYNSKINATNLQSDLTNERVSWFGKWNNNVKLPKGFAIQFSGNYQSKTILPQNSGGGGRGGGGFFGASNYGSAQGYVYPYYSFDMAIKQDFTWKGGNTVTASLSMNDIFKTAYYKTYSTSDFGNGQSFDQVTNKIRDPQILRFNISYRFGKIDATLFKRKDTKSEGGMDVSPGSGS